MNFKGFEVSTLKAKKWDAFFIAKNSPSNNEQDALIELTEHQSITNPAASNDLIIPYKQNSFSFFPIKNNKPQLPPVVNPPKIIKKITILPIIAPSNKIQPNTPIIKPLKEKERDHTIKRQQYLRTKKLNSVRVYKKEQCKAYKTRLKKQHYYLYYWVPLMKKINRPHDSFERSINHYHFFPSVNSLVPKEYVDDSVHIRNQAKRIRNLN